MAASVACENLLAAFGYWVEREITYKLLQPTDENLWLFLMTHDELEKKRTGNSCFLDLGLQEGKSTYYKINHQITVHRQIKRSHSIGMLSIQIDTKTFKLVQHYQIILLCQPFEMEFNRCCTVTRQPIENVLLDPMGILLEWHD